MTWALSMRRIMSLAGGLNIADELLDYNKERAMKKVETIYDTILKIFEISK